MSVVGCRHRDRTPAERGFGVFMRACAGCHGPDGRGTHPPGFSVAPRNLTDPVLQAHLDDAAIADTVRHGKGQMPPFGAALPDQDIADVVLYVRTLNRAATTPAGTAR
ncbi:MAG TPA: cytochrome c [Polyangiaceae bacterium]|nr:cytochrome c [Polyangiaceae bacterium]